MIDTPHELAEGRDSKQPSAIHVQRARHDLFAVSSHLVSFEKDSSRCPAGELYDTHIHVGNAAHHQDVGTPINIVGLGLWPNEEVGARMIRTLHIDRVPPPETIGNREIEKRIAARPPIKRGLWVTFERENSGTLAHPTDRLDMRIVPDRAFALNLPAA